MLHQTIDQLKMDTCSRCIKLHRAGIVCFQKAHLKVHDEHYAKEIYNGIVYDSSAGTKRQGILVGKYKALPWELGISFFVPAFY